MRSLQRMGELGHTLDVYAMELFELPNDIPIAWTSGVAPSPSSWTPILPDTIDYQWKFRLSLLFHHREGSRSSTCARLNFFREPQPFSLASIRLDPFLVLAPVIYMQQRRRNVNCYAWRCCSNKITILGQWPHRNSFFQARRSVLTSCLFHPTPIYPSNLVQAYDMSLPRP